MTATLLRGARLWGDDRPSEVLIAHGRIVATRVTRHELAEVELGEVIDLEGRFIGPGLWDQHVHVGAWAVHARRFDVAGASSAAATAALVREAVTANPPAAGTVFVGQGFRDGLWPDLPTAELLDVGDIPIVLISGDLHCVWSNRAALRMLQRPETDWLLREQPAFDLTIALSTVPVPQLDAWVADGVRAAAARGVVGISDLEMDDAVGSWSRRSAAGSPGIRVRAAVYPDHLAAAPATGTALDAAGLVTVGNYKLFTDGSLNTRTAWCDDAYPGTAQSGLPSYQPAELLAAAREGVARGIVPTIHAIGDQAVSLALDTFAALAADGHRGGRLEHAQLVATRDLPRFSELELVVSVQPEHAMDDRDVADRFWAGRTDRAFAYRSLLDAGATLALGSDAPVAPLDPWITLAAAVTRTRDGRAAWHPEQCLPVADALRASANGIAALESGGVADVVVTERDPLTASGDELRAMPVWGTMVAGEWTSRAG